MTLADRKENTKRDDGPFLTQPFGNGPKALFYMQRFSPPWLFRLSHFYAFGRGFLEGFSSDRSFFRVFYLTTHVLVGLSIWSFDQSFTLLDIYMYFMGFREFRILLVDFMGDVVRNEL